MHTLRGIGLLLVSGLLAASGIGFAAPLGPDPTLEFEGKVGFSATADTLLECGGVACAGDLGVDLGGLAGGANCSGRDRSTVLFDDLPVSETFGVLHARLNWVASTPANQAPDAEVTLTLPGGQPFEVLADPEMSEAFVDGAPPQDCMIAGLLCGGNIACELGFYSNHADITDAVRAHYQNGGALNGPWSIGDVSIPGARGDDPATAIAALGSLTIGAWSVIVIYEDNANLPTRRLYYYQGFELNSGVDRRLFPRGFLAPPAPALDLAIMILEGDADIAGDQLTVNGRQVTDGCNPVNNLFNSTVNTGTADGLCREGVTGVDLDRFTIEGAIQQGDEEADLLLTIPQGNGLTPGEQLFTNWLILSFDHLLPDFDSFKPEKVSQPSNGSEVRPGDEIQYRITIANRGDAEATNVVLTDEVPRGTTYVVGSSELNMAPFPDDPGGVMPLAGGLNLTDLAQIGDAIEVGSRHTFSFRVRVNDDAPHGFQITNIARISADLIDVLRTDPVVHVVRANDGGLPTPALDAGLEPSDVGSLMPATDQGTPQADAEMQRVTRDMRPDGPYPECEAGYRYDPDCDPAGCVLEANPPCDRFCPDPVPEGFVPVECNTGLAATACAEGRTCARISLEDPSVFACVPDEDVPYPACGDDDPCAFGFECHRGICLRLCPQAQGQGGGAADGCGCEAAEGSPGSFLVLLLGLGALGLRRRSRR